jgi:DNA-binding LacI/PurR family transcriptional regulator
MTSLLAEPKERSAIRTKTPKYRALTEHLREQVARGELQPGDRLLSFAEMSAEFGATPTTVTRVYAALEQEGLIVREPGRGTFVARTPRRASGILGVLVPSPVHATAVPYWTYLLNGIRKAAHDAGREILLLGDCTPSLGWEKLDGVLVFGMFDQAQRRLPPGMPCVSLVVALDDMAGVVANDYMGNKLLTEHLLALGHRRIAALTMGGADRILSQRLAGMEAALWEAGLKPNPRYLRPLRRGDEPVTEFDVLARARMREWLAEDWSTLGCTALLAHNDEAAIGAIEALREAGLRVPEDISITGFDGTKVSEYYSPRLTTIEVPLEEIGARATARLLEQIEERGSKTLHDVLPVKLKIGASTGKAPSGSRARVLHGKIS